MTRANGYNTAELQPVTDQVQRFAGHGLALNQNYG